MEKNGVDQQITAAFNAFWRAYPKRSGANPKGPALKAFIQRVKEGVPIERIIDAADRYAKWCAATGKVGGELVKQARYWLAPSYEGWDQAWTLPRANSLVPPQETSSLPDIPVEIDPVSGRLKPSSGGRAASSPTASSPTPSSGGLPVGPLADPSGDAWEAEEGPF
jgi:hypothetical protein